MQAPSQLGLHRVGPGLFSAVSCHLLVSGDGDAREAVLIDSGFCTHFVHLKWLFGRLGLRPEQLRAVLQTHGHLDHAGCLHEIVRWSGASVYMHPADGRILCGEYPYQRIARVCGVMEAVGRRIIRYTACEATHEIGDGDELPFWGGLRVVHLPGHTEGHCGFYSARHDLLFAGDLVAAFPLRVRTAPPIFNAVPERFGEAFERVRSLAPRRAVFNHYRRLNPDAHGPALQRYAEQYLRRRPAQGREVEASLSQRCGEARG